MAHARHKVRWCLRKAERELNEQGKHRALLRTEPDSERAAEHMGKAEHYHQATDYLKRGNFTDISASTVFYSMYRCLLAIAAKFGYESRNQECTFALIHSLVEEGKINLDRMLLSRIASSDIEESRERTSVSLREQYQYGTSLSMKDNLYEELFELARTVLSRTKVILEQ